MWMLNKLYYIHTMEYYSAIKIKKKKNYGYTHYTENGTELNKRKRKTNPKRLHTI